ILYSLLRSSSPTILPHPLRRRVIVEDKTPSSWPSSTSICPIPAGDTTTRCIWGHCSLSMRSSSASLSCQTDIAPVLLPISILSWIQEEDKLLPNDDVVQRRRHGYR
ncbi:hypothetical protein LINPERHAP2_LOCUS30615, partial [Linum perenne]